MKMDTDNNNQVLSEIHRLTSEARQAKTTNVAVELYKDAYKQSRQLDDDKIERICALNLGAALIENENPQAGLYYLDKATPPDSETQDGHHLNGDLYFNKGFANEKLGKKKDALELFRKAMEGYELEHNAPMKKQCCLKMGQIFCDIATRYKVDPEKTEDAEAMADKCLELNLHDIALEKSECIDASKVLNELGLLYTQLQCYDKATQSFEKAVELCRQSGATSNDQLTAVLLQNLGAAYNFQGDYQRSIKFHEDAEKKYTKIGNYRIGRNGQGQCFMNLAYAYCQLEGGASDNAFSTFKEAKKAAEDTDDRHMLWQAFEGLGAVHFNRANFTESAENYREALQRISDEENSKRVADKLEIALQYKMSQRSSGQMLQPYQQRHSTQVQPTLMQQMQSTLDGAQAKQIIPHKVIAAGQNMMSSVREQTVPDKRRFLQMRKKDSIGPHLPKMARGFGTLSQRSSFMNPVDSPRYQQTSGLEPDNLSEKTEDESESDSDDNSSDDDDDETISKVSDTPQVKEIFRQSPSKLMQMSPVRDETYANSSLTKYANLLQEKEANEGKTRHEDDDDDDDDDDSEDDTDEETDETTSDDDDDDDIPALSKRASQAPPPLPTQSPPPTALNSKDLGTYLNSNSKSTLDNPDNDHSSRQEPERSSGQQRQSPIPTTSDTEPPYATIGSIKRMGEEANTDSTGFHVGENGGQEADGIHVLDNLPRGQREQILHEQHVKRQREEAERTPPTLPDRKDNKRQNVQVKFDDDDDSEDTDDDDDDDNDDDDLRNVNQKRASQASPPLPTQSPPPTTLNSTDLGTYVNSDLKSIPGNLETDFSSRQDPGMSPNQQRQPLKPTTNESESPYANIGSMEGTGPRKGLTFPKKVYNDDDSEDYPQETDEDDEDDEFDDDDDDEDDGVRIVAERVPGHQRQPPQPPTNGRESPYATIGSMEGTLTVENESEEDSNLPTYNKSAADEFTNFDPKTRKMSINEGSMVSNKDKKDDGEVKKRDSGKSEGSPSGQSNRSETTKYPDEKKSKTCAIM